MCDTKLLDSEASLIIYSNGSKVKKPKEDKEKRVNDPASFQNQTKFELKVVSDGITIFTWVDIQYNNFYVKYWPDK